MQADVYALGVTLYQMVVGDLYRRVLAIRDKVLVPEHRDMKKALEDYALLLRAMGREAEELEGRIGK